MSTVESEVAQAHADILQKCYDWKDAADVRERGLYPYFRAIEGYNGARVIAEGRELLMAGSNNYLGLSLDHRVRDAALEAIEVYGTSCSGSRFLNGTLKLHEDLEERLAGFVGKEAALCFTTGYQSNLGAISALVGRGDHIITDKLNHASIMDGVFLAQGMSRDVRVHRFKHKNLTQLRRILEDIPRDEPKLIVTDGVFSMEGDVADLPNIRQLADAYGARVYLDEAHSVGVIGETGRGTLEYYGDTELADLVMCTFSKSFGSIGGFIAGEHAVIDYIKHFARSLIFSASIPPANLAATMKSLEIIEQEPDRVRRLQQIAEKMIKGFQDIGFDTGTTETAIVPIILGDNEKTFTFWKYLYENGVYVNPVVSPAVPPDKALLRTSYMAIHGDEELDTILETAEAGGKKCGII
jgi:8-amino-7-oxononanoate synthase